MKLDEKIRKRLDELISQAVRLSRYNENDEHVSATSFECTAWLASTANLVETMFPNPQAVLRKAAHSAATVGGHGYRVGNVNAVLKAIVTDIDAGVVTSIADTASAAVFDDFIDHAQHHLDNKRVAQAGVLAGVAFEDLFRRLCEKRAIGAKREAGAKRDELEQLIILMEKAGQLTQVQGKRARVAGAVRTKATHADWSEFGAKDVQATIDFSRELIEQLDRG